MWPLWPALLLAPAWAAAQEPAVQEQAAQQEEFLDFLEYLGSWDGAEEDWVQFLEEAERARPARDVADEEPGQHEDEDDAVS